MAIFPSGKSGQDRSARHVRRAPAFAEVFACDLDIRRASQLGEFAPCAAAAQQDMGERFQPLMGERRIWSVEASAMGAEK